VTAADGHFAVDEPGGPAGVLDRIGRIYAVLVLSCPKAGKTASILPRSLPVA
jgi:hypothetical protein